MVRVRPSVPRNSYKSFRISKDESVFPCFRAFSTKKIGAIFFAVARRGIEPLEAGPAGRGSDLPGRSGSRGPGPGPGIGRGEGGGVGWDNRWKSFVFMMMQGDDVRAQCTLCA